MSNSDTDQGYGGSTGIFGLEDWQNQEETPELDTGSGDYASMFASVKEKYLRNTDADQTISPRAPGETLFLDKEFPMDSATIHGTK